MRIRSIVIALALLATSESATAATLSKEEALSALPPIPCHELTGARYAYPASPTLMWGADRHFSGDTVDGIQQAAPDDHPGRELEILPPAELRRYDRCYSQQQAERGEAVGNRVAEDVIQERRMSVRRDRHTFCIRAPILSSRPLPAEG